MDAKVEGKPGPSKHLGVVLTIFVYFGDNVSLVKLPDTAYVIELREAIKAKFHPLLESYAAPQLIVHTKDADKLHLLDNAKLALADALKCNSKGEYEVYVEVPKVEAASSLTYYVSCFIVL